MRICNDWFGMGIVLNSKQVHIIRSNKNEHGMVFTIIEDLKYTTTVDHDSIPAKSVQA